jgi:hypothetical protein
MKSLLKALNEGTKGKKLYKPLITVITPCDDVLYLEKTLLGLSQQDYKHYEHILISKDLRSIDAFIKRYKFRVDEILEVDNGNMFEMINKGIEASNGEIVFILKPGDVFYNEKVLSEVVDYMEFNKLDICWGDLIYVGRENTDKPIMYWRSSEYKKGVMEKGWLPPFSSMFIRKNVYERCGFYNTSLKVAADYEFILRLFKKHKFKNGYFPQITTKMIGKGLSIKSIVDRIVGNIETYKSWNQVGLSAHWEVLLGKNFSKILQFLNKGSML